MQKELNGTRLNDCPRVGAAIRVDGCWSYGAGKSYPWCGKNTAHSEELSLHPSLRNRAPSCVIQSDVRGGDRIHPETARKRGRHGVQYAVHREGMCGTGAGCLAIDYQSLYTIRHTL